MMINQITAIEIDCETGEETIRPLTSEELADLHARQANALANPMEPPKSEADILREQLAALTARLEAAGL